MKEVLMDFAWVVHGGEYYKVIIETKMLAILPRYIIQGNVL